VNILLKIVGDGLIYCSQQFLASRKLYGFEKKLLGTLGDALS
jgi:hypothetical protein